jgi:hypothetical protein
VEPNIGRQFEGAKSWDLDWHGRAADSEMERFWMAAYWPTAQGEVASFMNRLPKIVASRALKSACSHSSSADGISRASRARRGMSRSTWHRHFPTDEE